MPTDESMSLYLTNTPMLIKVNIWEMEVTDENGEKNKMRGNWVASVSPKGGAKAAPKPSTPVEVDDEVPF